MKMSKIVLKATFLLVSIVALFCVGTRIFVNAAQTINMTNGAQIRTTGERQGLRFTTTVGEAFAEGSEHGYYLAKGEHDIADMIDAIEASASTIDGNKLVKKVFEDSDLTFSLVIYNIPQSAYKQDITALAYIKEGEVFTFPEIAVTRNIAEVAVAAYSSYEDDVPAIIASAATQQVNYNFNGGAFVAEKEFTITRYNADTTGAHVKISNAASGQYSMYYRVLYLEETSNPNVFEIVKYTNATTVDTSGAYDLYIGAHDTAVDHTGYLTVLSLMAPSSIGKYISLSSIPTVAGTVSVKAKVFSSSEFTYACENAVQNYIGATTPKNVQKDYYDFVGWYDNAEFTGDAVTAIAAGNKGSAMNLYAKFTPTIYTINYELDSGSCSDEARATSYTYVSSAIALPLSGTMSRDGYDFVEWNTKADGTGETITSIPTGSHANITVYAIWASQVPTVVDLSSEDAAIINAINPTKFVNTLFTAGRFTIGENTYKVGEGELFATIASALSAASTNDVIYVFAGTYSDVANIAVNNLTLVGPGANKTLVHTDTYSVNVVTEALITKELIIDSGVSNTTIKGFSMTNQITISGNATVNISNIIFGDMTGFDTGFDGSIRIKAASSNITIDRVYFTSKCANRGVHVNALTTNFTLTNCVVLDSVSDLVDFCRFGQSNTLCAKGTIIFSNNYIQKCSQSGFMDRVPSTASYIFIHNTFDTVPAAIYMRANDSIGAASYEVKYNTFNKCGTTTLDWDDVALTTGASTIVNFNYNIITNSYDMSGCYNIKVRNDSGTINCANNYVDTASQPTDNLNATGFTLLDNAEAVATAYAAYLAG
ncbi:MAG: InlB B-repeat-containing protein [Bacilli bacterium]|nr:InlB B-repeat-containing protein [Bacilli bacterium]